jgi:hypothetical protein
MADVYWIGVFLGIGVGIGVLFAGLLGWSRPALLAAVALAGAAGFGLGIWLGDAPEAAAAAIGGIFGSVSAAEILRRALRRGGERLGMTVIGIAAGAAAAGLAFIPIVGYLEFLALPLLAVRLRRSEPERYGGLRTLARD